MYSELIVARMVPGADEAIAGLFGRFDETEMPHLMGTRRRQLFHFHGLYFHLQDFDDESGGDHIERAKTRPEFVQISADLRPHVSAYDPQTWKSPKDALATRFYHWSAQPAARHAA
jgi:cyclase